MTVADEPEYFEGSVALDKATGIVEVSTYRGSGKVLISIFVPLKVAPGYRPTPGIRLTPSDAKKLRRYLLKASKKARIHKREKCR